MQVGRYRLLERLAVGGMAEVFLATSGGDQGFEKYIVIKRLLKQHADSAQFNQMFLDEARIMLSLVHANIVQILDLGNMDGLPFLALEFVHGRDLRSVLERAEERETPMPLPLAVHIAREVARALEYAHGKTDRDGQALNIIHRDINPSNVFLSFEGAVKVGDFGLAKARDNMAKTEAGVVKGKLSYMSPEQVTGLPIDHRSDLFSLGASLYEMTVGQKPFQGNSPFQIVPLIAEGRYPLPSAKVPDYDPALEIIVQRALERDRDKRYESAGELQDDLGRYLQRFTIGERHLGAFLSALFDTEERRPPSSGPRAAAPAQAMMIPASTGEYVSQPQMLPPAPPAAERDAGRGAGRAEPVAPARAAAPVQLAPAPAAPAAPAAAASVGPAAPAPRAPAPRPPLPAGEPPFYGGQSAGAAPVILVPPEVPERRSSTLAVVLALILGGALVAIAWLRPWDRGPTSASVKVVSTPAGASILVDGKPSGQRTPATLEGLRTDRSYVIELRHPEGASSPRLFEPTQAQTYALSFELKALEQNLAIASAPAAASVTVDGEARGQTPVVLKLPRGRTFRIEVSLAGHESQVREHVSSEEVASLALVLNPLTAGKEKDRPKAPRAAPPAPAASTAAAHPLGPHVPTGFIELEGSQRAEVYVDGRLAGHMPGFRMRLRAGTHQLSVRLKAGKRHEAKVEVQAGKTWKLRLEP